MFYLPIYKHILWLTIQLVFKYCSEEIEFNFDWQRSEWLFDNTPGEYSALWLEAKINVRSQGRSRRSQNANRCDERVFVFAQVFRTRFHHKTRCTSLLCLSGILNCRWITSIRGNAGGLKSVECGSVIPGTSTWPPSNSSIGFSFLSRGNRLEIVWIVTLQVFLFVSGRSSFSHKEVYGCLFVSTQQHQTSQP